MSLWSASPNEAHWESQIKRPARELCECQHADANECAAVWHGAGEAKCCPCPCHEGMCNAIAERDAEISRLRAENERLQKVVTAARSFVHAPDAYGAFFELCAALTSLGEIKGG